MVAFSGKYGLVAGIALCLLSLTACNSGSVSLSAPVDPCGWSRGEEKRVVLLNADTVSMRNLYVFVAYDHMMYSDGLTLQVSVTSPDFLTFTDTVRIAVEAPERNGKMNVSRRLYRSDAVLDRMGEYSFSFRHVQGEPVKGIRAVGIEITDIGNGER